MSEILKYKKALNFRANPRYLTRDFIVPLYTGTEPDIYEDKKPNMNDPGMVVDPSRILPKNFTDDMPFVTDENNPEELELAGGGSVERQGFKFGTRKELIDKMSKSGFDKYPSFLKYPEKLAKSYNIKTKPSSDNKSHYLYDIPSDKKLSSILETIETNRTRPRSGAFKKAQEILNNPKLKKEFIKFGSQLGVTGKQIREKYKISTSEFFQSGLRDLFNKNFQTDYRASVRPETIERMKQILNNKKFNKLLNEGILPKHKDLKKTFKFTPNEASTAVFRIGQSFIGQKFENIENLNIPKNKKAGKMLLDEISKAVFGNPYSSAARTDILNKIDSQMGNKIGSFNSFRRTIINTLKDNGLDEKLLKNFNLNEIAGVSAAGKNKMAPYAYFVNLVDSKINQGALASFNVLYGKKTNELIKAVSQFKRTGDDTKVKEVLNSFEESKNNFLGNIRPKARKEIERVGLPGLSVNSPEIEFGKRRINQLSKLGLDLPTTFEKTGVTMTMPKGSLTLEDLKNNPQALTKFIKTVALDFADELSKEDARAVCGKLNLGGLPKGCAELAKEDPEKFIKTVAETTKDAGLATKANQAFNTAKKIVSAADEVILLGKGVAGRTLAPLAIINSALEQFTAGNYREAYRQVFDFLDPLPFIGISRLEKSRQEGSIENVRSRIGKENQESFNRVLEAKEVFDKLTDVNTRLERAEYATQDPNAAPESYDPDYINDLKKQQTDLDKILNSSRYQNARNDILNVGNALRKETYLRNIGKPEQEKIVYDTANLETLTRIFGSNFLNQFEDINKVIVPNLTAADVIREKQKNIPPMSDAQRTAIESMGESYSSPEKIEVLPQQKTGIPFVEEQEKLPSDYIVSAAEGGYIDYLREYRRYMIGGRVKLNEGGGGPKLSRRGFLGFLAGAAASPFVIKAMKGKKLLPGAKVATKVLPKVAGMPDWFNPLVTRIMNEGVDISPKAERVEDIVKVKKLEFPMPEEGTTKFRKSGIGFEKKNIETITMTEYPDGRIEIEADVFGGSFDAPFSLNYRPPKTDINVQTGEPVKYPGDFSVVEQRPKPDYGDPGNFEIDYEVMSVDDTISDLEKLEKIGTGKRIHPKKVEKRTGARKFVEENPSEDIVNRYGDGEIEYDRMKDEGLFDETE